MEEHRIYSPTPSPSRSFRLLLHDASTLWPLPDKSVQCIVTSPPYWGLRDYGVDQQLGLERTPEEYVAKMVGVFREASRVLRDDGTLWLNLGDSYARSPSRGIKFQSGSQTYLKNQQAIEGNRGPDVPFGLKEKDLVGIPWRVAFALQADGWWLRSDIIWHKPNPMPESVTDRPTKAHEYLFLMSKSERYYYDAEAIAERGAGGRQLFSGDQFGSKGLDKWGRNDHGRVDKNICEIRNRRSVWTVPTSPFPEAHFATFPPALIEPCIKAGSKGGDIVVDPFVGSGTTGLVSLRLNRSFVGMDINQEYLDMAHRRIEGDAPLFNKAIP